MSGFSYQQTATFLLEDENWAGLPPLNCYMPPVNTSSEELETKKKSPAGSSTVVIKKRKNTVSSSSKRLKKEAEAKDVDEKSKKALEEPPKGYIHVRARRGQATDSHSLAERVRREKISERMKTLQSLVPGCDKVSGKALVLDEIINYVQSLQNQVEFLSMKLASMNPASMNPLFYEFGMGIDELQYLTAMEAVSPFVLIQGQRQGDIVGSALSESDHQCLKTLTPPLFDNGFVFSPMK